MKRLVMVAFTGAVFTFLVRSDEAVAASQPFSSDDFHAHFHGGHCGFNGRGGAHAYFQYGYGGHETASFFDGAGYSGCASDCDGGQDAPGDRFNQPADSGNDQHRLHLDVGDACGLETATPHKLGEAVFLMISPRSADPKVDKSLGSVGPPRAARSVKRVTPVGFIQIPVGSVSKWGAQPI
ncbi:hypothetical protein [Aporhodopirellula aestuarii]|uniref:Uncharacterized protein n=1 Tax=Aporhodopirellula aestuarii TaxID=2950107 RepID=A0ABT0U3E5_9BACT|nr:hypothetical protein [Aporhodopirellula aestuarii]MCM2371370.1 hypothetical protein [Aporhodopirellula aestuarii]